MAVLNTANEPVQVEVSGDLLIGTAEGAEVEDGLLTVPAASTAWLRD